MVEIDADSSAKGEEAPFDLSLVFSRHVARREHPKTLCPSEIARSLSRADLARLGVSEWRDLMPRLREMAFEARDKGEIQVLQKGEVVPPDLGMDKVKGPIRIRKAVLHR
ncbi:hypothetical protein PV08_10809 [Exophiala spinifera]|uniref:S-adenosylmethionine tRNA ribosyltransferase n=1 Tax=Exophiala spinifera TaxID=91928 RepID=A0A0D2AXW9_9EURO|nr:uncharacterized protein PV08_10809 [Exophiala spinifera]KIW11508.1 hypothetical protein PV08_10809 [Exophiala spinifera]